MLNWFIQQLHIWVPAPNATEKVLMGTVGQRNMTRHVSSYVAEHCWKAEKVALYLPQSSITTCCSVPGMMGMDSGCGGAPQFQPMGQAMGQAMAQPGQPMGQAMAPMGMEGYGLPAVAPMGQLPQMAQMQAATTLPQVGVTMPATVTHVPGGGAAGAGFRGYPELPAEFQRHIATQNWFSRFCNIDTARSTHTLMLLEA